MIVLYKVLCEEIGYYLVNKIMTTFREFVAKSEMKDKVGKLSKLMSNLFFIPKFSKSKMKTEGKAHDETLKYWTDPNSPLIPWLKSLNVELPDEIPPSYADGGAGRCYFLIDHVVKMSANRVEANVATMVAGRDDVPAPIVAVKYLGDNIYAILQHWVDTIGVPQEMRKAADFMTVLIDENPEMDGFPSSEKEREDLCLKTLRDNGGNDDLLPHMLVMMDTLSMLYGATGFKHDDAGPTNIGMYKGRVVIPDLGPNEPKGFDPLSALAQIQKNRAKIGLPRWKSV